MKLEKMLRAPLLHALILVILVIGASDAKRLSGMHMSAYERLSIEGDDKIHLNFQRQRHQMKRLRSNRRIELDLLQVIILFFGPNSTPQLPPGLISRGHICFCGSHCSITMRPLVGPSVVRLKKQDQPTAERLLL